MTMKLLPICSLLLLIDIHRAWSQDRSQIQRSSIAVHLIADHFPQRDSIHLPGSSDRFTIGLAVSFLKGLTPRLDLHATLTASFPKLTGTGNTGRHAFGEMDVSVRAKLIPGNPSINPFLQAGAGIAGYDGHRSLLFPAGAGLQANLPGETFLLFHVQYRFAAASWEPSHLFCSAGIAGIVGRKKNVHTRRRPVLPPAGSASRMNKSRDRDGDGITDSLDACPDTPGDIAAAGCPVIDTTHVTYHSPAADIREKFKEAAKNVFFETDRYTLLPTSYQALGQAAALLAAHPQLDLLIEGHTDSTGRPDANQLLSQRRADAVRDYLVGQGIDAKRLSAKGYGRTRPVADNGTASGRALNRRVELIPFERP